MTVFAINRRLLLLLALPWASVLLHAQQTPCPLTASVASQANGVIFGSMSSRILHIHVGEASQPSFVEIRHNVVQEPHTEYHVATAHCATRLFKDILVTASGAHDLTITTEDPSISLSLSMQHAAEGAISLVRKDALDLFGMGGLERGASSLITRNQGALVRAGSQGDAGAPFFFTTQYGLLFGSDGGRFSVQSSTITYTTDADKPLTDIYLFFGSPLQTMTSLAEVSGHSPMPPRWTLGFLHSLWGSNEQKIRAIAQQYADKQIPLNAFILDFDWKAWGEDNYGEWRWNSTNTDESFSPDLFPDGASGSFAAELQRQGIFIAGILKPRILLYRKGTKVLHEAARFAEDHHLWYPEEPITNDYFTHRPSRDLDFNLPETRSWYWEHLEPTFHAGIAGWWNDEADHTLLSDGTVFNFNNLQFAHMGQAIYEGQRLSSNIRVWSINRNFFLGAQRYAYAEWSGDIDTGWKSMQDQPARMISTLNLGEEHWSMDTGGFKADPTPENYARWIEFAAFVPIMRVHGNLGLNRAPWAFGEVAERAASQAIRLRSALLPYIYSAERTDFSSGIGPVRPLLWEYPNDPQARLLTNEWMFGDSLLASPVLVQSEKSHSTYLPSGEWIDYWTGNSFSGQQTIQRPTDSAGWTDIPLYVRRGSIVALTEPEGLAIKNPCSVVLDMFPAKDANIPFQLYEDDGLSYDYEKHSYFQQIISMQQDRSEVRLNFAAASGTHDPSTTCVILRVHSDAILGPVSNRAAIQCSPSQRFLLSELSPDRKHVAACLVVEMSRRPKLIDIPIAAAKKNMLRASP